MRWVRPRAVPPGGTVGIVAPSGPVDEEALERGIAAIHGLGFRSRLGERVFDRRGYLAGNDEDRATDFNEMFRDPSVDAVICARGGYGATRILHLVDYAAIRSSRKVFVGFSDITALHIAIHNYSRLVTFHGPAVQARDESLVNEYSVSRLLRAVTSREPLGELSNPPGEPAPSGYCCGSARGRLTGGNLSLVVASIGTPYEIDTRGAILALEEVSERPYRIDRLLRQLKLAGKLERVAGVALGEFVRCEPEPGKPSLTLEEVYADYFGVLGVPVVSGLRFGHGMFRMTLPFGVMAEIDGDRGSLKIIEPATV